MTKKKGRMITIYGINNIGKSTQVDLLMEGLIEKKFTVFKLKYPIYDLEPEGPIINKYLRDPEYRHNHKMTVHKLQGLYVKNRRRYEPALKELLEQGTIVVAEDYVLTGRAWGEAQGGDYDYLKEINQGLYKEDLSILMDGERFTDSIERGHLNETDSSLVDRCRKIFLELADDYGCVKVDANQRIEDVQADIWKIVSNALKQGEY